MNEFILKGRSGHSKILKNTQLSNEKQYNERIPNGILIQDY